MLTFGSSGPRHDSAWLHQIHRAVRAEHKCRRFVEVQPGYSPKVHAIGNILKEEWFSPEEFYKEFYKEASDAVGD